MNTALVIVDIQNDYFPGGRMELSGAVEAARRARELLDLFRSRDLPRFFVQHVSTSPDASFFRPGSDGVEIHLDVLPGADEPVIRKHFPNSFRDTALLDHLRAEGIQQIVVCGMMTHMCIDATARAAADLGFDCLIAGDACATRDLEREGRVVAAAQVHDAFLAALDGTYGKVLPAAAIAARVLKQPAAV